MRKPILYVVLQWSLTKTDVTSKSDHNPFRIWIGGSYKSLRKNGNLLLHQSPLTICKWRHSEENNIEKTEYKAHDT